MLAWQRRVRRSCAGGAGLADRVECVCVCVCVCVRDASHCSYSSDLLSFPLFTLIYVHLFI